jgi:DNA-binding XRE family transcriptional regulator
VYDLCDGKFEISSRKELPMPNIASALKEEIARVARKEIRKENDGFQKATAQFRTEISTLKRRVAELEKMIARLNRGAGLEKRAKADPDQAPPIRFSAKGLVSLRQRLGLTAAELGALLAVSPQTIYNWEAEKSRPRQKQMVAFAEVRGLGKKEVAARLEAMAG